MTIYLFKWRFFCNFARFFVYLGIYAQKRTCNNSDFNGMQTDGRYVSVCSYSIDA